MSKKRPASFPLPPKKRAKASSSFGSRYVSSLLGTSRKRPVQKKSNWLQKQSFMKSIPVTLNRPKVSTFNRSLLHNHRKPATTIQRVPSTSRAHTFNGPSISSSPKSKNVCQVCFRDFSPHIMLGDRALECCICGVFVHPLCYGKTNKASLTPWFCDKCEAGCHHSPKCEICGLSTFGAFKKVESGGWAHLVCAMWIPNTYVKSTKTMSPVAGLEDIVAERKSLTCIYCGLSGNCVQCNSKSCSASFHVLCAQKYDPKLLVTVSVQDKKLFAFCEKHHPHRKRRKPKPRIEEEDEDSESEEDPTSKSSRGRGKSTTKFRCYRCGKPFKGEGSHRRHVKHCSASVWLPQYRGNDWMVQTISSKNSDSISPPKCPYCPLRVIAGTETRGGLFAHILSVHHSDLFSKVMNSSYLHRRNIGVQSMLDVIDTKVDAIEDLTASHDKNEECCLTVG